MVCWCWARVRACVRVQAVAALAGRRAVTWSKDCTARVWELGGAAVRAVCEGHVDGVRCAALSADEVSRSRLVAQGLGA